MRLAILILLAVLTSSGATLTLAYGTGRTANAAYAAELALALIGVVALGAVVGGRR